MGDDPEGGRLKQTETQKPQSSLMPPVLIALIVIAGFLALVSNLPSGNRGRDDADVPGYEEVRVQGLIHLVVVKSDDREALHRIGEFICRDQQVCSVQFWLDRDKVPFRLENIRDDQVAARVNTFWLNRNTGIDELMR